MSTIDVNSLTDGEMKYVIESNVSCDEYLDLVNWRNAKVLSSLLFLAVINVIVILGNLLVIMAVMSTTKLRTVTNLFIVSLAVADLMVGIAVLPFSATWEILEVWIFGEVWCSMWLAVDVWMCTASILNLCAISLDRYVAVTRPVTYPSIMSSRKAKLLICCVWVLSFLICFPPLVGWNDRKRTFFRQLITNTTNTTESNFLEGIGEDPESGLKYQVQECAHTCELTNDKGYVVYSALGSFFLPMFVMMFFYWRIYRAAVETTRAINQGFRTTKGSRLLGTRFEEQRLTLRIHRGRSVQNNHHRSTSPNPISPNGRINSAHSHSSSTRVPRSRSHEKIKVHLTPPPRVGKRSSSYKPRNTFSGSANSSPTRRPVLSTSPGSSLSSNCSPALSGGRTVDQLNLPVPDMGGHGNHRRVHGSESEASTPSLSPIHCPGGGSVRYETLSPGPSPGHPAQNNQQSGGEQDPKPKLISKMGKRNIKAQVKRFRMETKAAKTLGIIVGGFILCWLPFFTMYVIRAFCSTCIPPLLFSVLFWLGYCNSALNPCIYALFSKDFRFAFKKIICRCICQTEKKPKLQVVPIFLSSLGEDSDGNGNGNNEQGSSDSRRNSLDAAMLV